MCAPEYTVMPAVHKALARSEAQFQLVRHLANQSLVPVGNVILPEALSSEVHTVSNPLDLLKRVAKEQGWSVEANVRPSRKLVRAAGGGAAEYVTGQTAMIVLRDAHTGEELKRSEKFAADDPNEQRSWLSADQDALRRAAQRMLRVEPVKSKVPQNVYVNFDAPEDPLVALQDLAVEQGTTVRFSLPQAVQENAQRQFCVELRVMRGKEPLWVGDVTTDSDDRAKFLLAQRALSFLRSQEQEVPPQSRISDVQHHVLPTATSLGGVAL